MNPPSPPPGFLGKDPLTMSECITRLYQQGTQVFEHFEALRNTIEDEMNSWNSFLMGERLVAARIEKSPAVNRVLTEMEKRSTKICGLVRNVKTVFKRLLAFHNDFLGIMDTLKAERGENIMLKLEIERYKKMLQDFEKMEKSSTTPSVSEDENREKKNASPEVVILEAKDETIEISSQSSQSTVRKDSTENSTPFKLTGSTEFELSPEVIAFLAESRKSPFTLDKEEIRDIVSVQDKSKMSSQELSPEKTKNTSPTHSANDDVLQLDLDDISLEELNNELDPPKAAVEFAKNFYIHDNEWDEVLKTSERLAAKTVPAIEVLNEVLEKATVDVISKIPPILLSSDSEATLPSDEFETVEEESCSSDSSVEIPEPIKRRKRDNLSVKPDQIFCAVKTRMPVMIPLERISSVEEIVDPRERKKKTEVPKELAKSALKPDTVPSTSNFRIPKKTETEKKRPVRERLGPLPVVTSPAPVLARERLGPSFSTRPTVSGPSENSMRMTPYSPVLRPLSTPPRGILKNNSIQPSSNRNIRFDDMLAAANLIPGSFDWKEEGTRKRVIYRLLNGNSGSFSSDLIPRVQSPFFPSHIIHGIIQPRISICARLGKVFVAHQQWKRIIIDKNVPRSLVSSDTLASGIKYEDLEEPFPQRVNLVRQQRVVSTQYVEILFLGNIGQKFVLDAGVVDRKLYPGFGANLILLGQDFIRNHAAGLDFAGKRDGNAVGRIVLRSVTPDRPFWSTTYQFPDDDEL